MCREPDCRRLPLKLPQHAAAALLRHCGGKISLPKGVDLMKQ
jgi:hypothetical protein